MKKMELLLKINGGYERGARAKLAKVLGITLGGVSRWFQGKEKPSLQNIDKMARIFDIPAEEIKEAFYSEEEQAETPYQPQPGEFEQTVKAVPLTKSNTIQLPILADVPAGLPEFSDRDVEMFVDIPRFLFPGADFIVRCSGDSLEPKIHKGDFCVIRKMQEPLDGRAMLIKSENGVCMKVIKKQGDGITLLCSTNPKYKPFTPKELTIIGLIIGHWSRDDREHWS